MIDAGQMALVMSLLVAGYSAVASLVGASLKVPQLTASGRFGLYTVPVLVSVSMIGVVYAFVTHDFSVRYVAENSNLSMPKVYTWVALYAGNAGSMLFLAMVVSILSVLAVFHLRRRQPHAAAYAAGLMGLMLVFFLGVMVFLANPLERLPVIPADGQGINPLLVHFGMFIHPPLQMMGLVSVVIPFSIAMGALLAGRGGQDDWVDVARTWAMVSWLIMTIGLLLGAWWAYTILGWGGYWAWDPVENSAFMPWLAMTAFVHSIMVQKRRGMFRMWNMVLIIVAVTLAQMGMFINRGGPVPSVHSFAQSTMGWLFLFYMAFTLLGSAAAFVWRMDSLKSREKLESLVSRESMFLLQNVLFLTVAFVTLWGTVFPIFSEAASDVTITVGRPFFDLVNGPILLTLVFIMGIGPLLPWRRASIRTVVQALKYPVSAAIVTGVVLVAAGLGKPPAIVAFATFALVITGIFHEWVRGTRSRHRKGESYPVAFGRLISANRPRYGGYIVHLAIIMLAVGATASSFYSVQRDLVMRPGDSASLGDYSFKYLGVSSTSYRDREESVAEFEVHKGGSYLGIMRPFRAFYTNANIAGTRGAIRSTLIEDFYIVPSEFDEDGRAVFRVLINPLVWWMWASGPLLILGVVIALIPQRQPAPATLRVPANVRAARA